MQTSERELMREDNETGDQMIMQNDPLDDHHPVPLPLRAVCL